MKNLYEEVKRLDKKVTVEANKRTAASGDEFERLTRTSTALENAQNELAYFVGSTQ